MAEKHATLQDIDARTGVSGPRRRVFTRAKETDRGVRAQLHAHGWMKQKKTSGDGGREWKNDDLQWWMEVVRGRGFLFSQVAGWFRLPLAFANALLRARGATTIRVSAYP